jgi:hypothetical protein
MRAARAHSLTVRIQHEMIGQALEDRRWRTTRDICDSVPWSMQTVFARLQEMERGGLVRSRRVRADQVVTEVHWRVVEGA